MELVGRNKYEKTIAKTLPAKSGVKSSAICFFIGFGIAGVWGYSAFSPKGQKQTAQTSLQSGNQTLTDSWSHLGCGGIPSVGDSMDIALANLSCCPMEAGAATEIPAMLAKLDKWAAEISLQTNRNYHRYKNNPKEYGSEAEWRMGIMCTILGQDLGVKYDPEMSLAQVQTASDDEFFSNPRKVFLQGLLGTESTGTCASLPVLYVALGRRLGYPMHLVSAKRHLFARWDDGKGVRVNLECSSAGGFVSHPDDHYRKWPVPMSPDEEVIGGYLKNFTNQECLAVFLTTRTACLTSRGERSKAILSAAQAVQIAPNLGVTQMAMRSAVGYSPQMTQAAFPEPPLHYPPSFPGVPSPYHNPSLPSFPQHNPSQPFRPYQPGLPNQ